MKSIFTLWCAMLCCSAVFGQWSVGPKVALGAVTASAQEIRIIPNSDKLPVSLEYLGGGSVMSVGFMAHNDIGPGFLQFEILGTTYNQSYVSTPNGFDDPRNVMEERIHILELPVIAGVNFNNLRVGVGPVLEVNVQKKTELSQLDGYVNKTDKIDGSFQFLIGYKKGLFNLDARYVNKFNGIIDEFGINEDILKLKKSANRFSISAGMLFGNSNRNVVEDAKLLKEKEIMVF